MTKVFFSFKYEISISYTLWVLNDAFRIIWMFFSIWVWKFVWELYREFCLIFIERGNSKVKIENQLIKWKQLFKNHDNDG